VKAAAVELGLPVTDKLPDALEAGAELGVVVAYGRIIPAALLEEMPMVNLHFSLLPRWRGAAPVERAILAGDTETGVCLMKVEEGLDTGPVYARRVVALGDDVDLETLRLRLVDVGSDLLVEYLAGGAAGLPVPEAQHGEPTIAHKLTAEDRHLHWEEAAVQLHRVVRLGGAWTTFRHLRLVIRKAWPDDDGTGPGPPGTLVGTAVITGRGALHLEEVQPEGRTPMAAGDWARGARPAQNERLGSD
jgi:methionyl-tRNA formyltransferase